MLSVRPLRLVIVVLAALFVMLQYALWFSDGGVFVTWKLQREIAAQVQENARLNDRNQTLAAEVVDLKQGLAAIEERARAELGMVKKGETFYQVVDPAVSPDKK